MFIYPNDLKAKPKLWLWELRDITIIGIVLLERLPLAGDSHRHLHYL